MTIEAPTPVRLSRKADLSVRRPSDFLIAGCLIVLLSLAVRLPRLADHSVWWDEGFAIYEARLPLLAAAYRTAFDVHPPLHYWFLHFWIRLVGESEFAVRYSTVLFAVLSVAVLAWAGRRLAGPWTGLFAALLLTLARIYIEWSQEMRMYTIATVLTALILYFTVALCQQPTRRRWLGLVVVGTVALYTLYIAGITLLAAGLGGLVYGLVQRSEWRARWHWFLLWLGAGAATSVLYSPWLIVLALTTRPAPRIEWTIDFRTFVHAYLTVMPLGISTYLDRYVIPTAFATLLLLIGIVSAWRSAKQRPLAVVGLAILVLAPVSVYVMSLPNPIYFKPNLEIRYVLILLPAYDLLLAWAIQTLWQIWRPASLLAALAMLGISSWSVWTYYPTKVKVDDYPS
ncbi:MAG TPA: glycosyltransferase family 39 protein, partial [Chloroflexota bacterium]|nr:glycosyltransferase family 39 protein [Chloroflexota bacterium]